MPLAEVKRLRRLVPADRYDTAFVALVAVAVAGVSIAIERAARAAIDTQLNWRVPSARCTIMDNAT